VDAPPDVVAVVLTHRRPRLATQWVRSLIEVEGFAPSAVVLVIDRDGGLEDPALEAAIRVVRLTSASGPAAGFRAGMEAAFADPAVRWAYLCEDDAGLLGLPAPRVASVLDAAAGVSGVGLIAAYGRQFAGRGRTVAFVPAASGPALQPVDVAAWGATLLSREAFDAGVRPDDFWFFAFEDFDFCLHVRAAGFSVLVDRESALATRAALASAAARDAALAADRPVDAEESWRAYYPARNFFEFARRHGSRGWVTWHLVLSLRRLQLAPDWATRRAILAGLRDGLLYGLRGSARRGGLVVGSAGSGRNPRYVRDVGEHPS
jgi:GT2 family glycosyltransferase